MTEFLLLIILILLGIFIRRTFSLRDELRLLRQEFSDLRRQFSRDEASSPVSPQPPAGEMAAAAPAPQPSLPPQPAMPEKPPAPRVPPSPSPVFLKKSASREEWEALIGGQWLNRIGALALIIGAIFFLKYAFDNNWINETVRVLLGGLAGLVLLLAAFRSHRKGFYIFSQGLFGAGIGLLYLSSYASYNFYQLIPQPAAFGLMIVITAASIFIALRYNALSIAILGWAGGFLTPLALSTGQASQVGLFSYIAFLDIALLAILYRKPNWSILKPLTLGATYLMYLLWFDQYYSPERLALTIFFPTLFWALFYAAALPGLLRAELSFASLDQAIASLNAALYYLFMHIILHPEHPAATALAALALGAAYLLPYLKVNSRQPEKEKSLASFAVIAVALLAIATAIQFSGYWRVFFWSLEGLALVGGGVRFNLKRIWQIALLLLAIATAGLLGELIFEAFPFGKPEYSLLFSKRTAAFLMAALACGLSAALLNRAGENRTGESRPAIIQQILHYAWSVLGFIWINVEINEYFRKLLEASPDDNEALEFRLLLLRYSAWMAYSLILSFFGASRRNPALRWVGLGIAGIAVFFSVFDLSWYRPIERFTVLWNGRALALLFLALGLFAQGQLVYRRELPLRRSRKVVTALRLAALLLILALVTAETNDAFDKKIVSFILENQTTDAHPQVKTLRDVQQLAISLVWLMYSIILMGVGIWRRMAGARFAAIGLFGLTILKIFVYDLSFLGTLYRFISFIGLGLVLLGVSYLYQRYKAVLFGNDAGRTAP